MGILNKFSATLISGGLNSDNGICDAARVSFSKLAANFTERENAGLLRYLKNHNHWSPFGHARETFFITDRVLTGVNWCWFLERANLSGFTWQRTPAGVFLSGSIWAWYENLSFLPQAIADSIRHWFLSTSAYKLSAPLLFREPVFAADNDVVWASYADTRDMANIVPVSFRVVGSIFIARQMVKHQIHLCWNEESRRYIDSPPSFYVPDVWRSRPDGSIKQGSGASPASITEVFREAMDNHWRDPLSLYSVAIDHGIAPEQARMVLPQSAITEWVWTGTVKAFSRVCKLRLDSHAQEEAQQLARDFDRGFSEYCPEMWASINSEVEYVEKG